MTKNDLTFKALVSTISDVNFLIDMTIKINKFKIDWFHEGS